MKRLVLPGLCLIVALLIAGCQNSAPAVSAPSLRQSPAASAAPASEGDLESTDMVQSSDGRMSVLGKTALFVSLKAMSAPPSAPSGWEFVGPVFDVIAQDRQRRPVHKLASALKLRFSVPTDGAVTVMVFDGAGWQVVPSDVDADGSLVADVDHLTPYVAASPKQASAIRRAPTVVPKVTPGARATVVTAPVSSSDALTELQNAAAAVKGKKVKVSSPAGYAGSLYVAVPDWLNASLESIGATGAGYYGLYNGVNEVFAAQAAGSSSAGTYTLLVEPKTSFPASAADATSSLTALFAGVPVASLAQARADTTSYVFYGASGSTAYGAGYVSYDGIALAYAMVGTGSYQPLVPRP